MKFIMRHRTCTACSGLICCNTGTLLRKVRKWVGRGNTASFSDVDKAVFNMAETGKESTAQGLKDKDEEVNKESLKSQSHTVTNPESMPSPGTPDLRSILVTSVLNLETLDTDLYRLHCF